MNARSDRTTRGFALRWVLLSSVGLGAGLAAGLGVAGPIEALVGMMLVTPIILGLAGSVFGASQWLAVWKWHRAGLAWILASAAALGVGMTLGIVVVEVGGRALTGEQMRLFGAGPSERVLALAVIGLLTGLVVGAAQGIALRAYGWKLSSWIARCALGFGLGLPVASLAADVFLGGLQTAAGFAAFLGVSGLILGGFTVRGVEKCVPNLSSP